MLNFWEGSGSGPVIENHSICGSWINLCFEDLFGGGTLACHVEGLGLVSFFSTAKEQLGNEKTGQARLTVSRSAACSLANALTSGKYLGYMESHVDRAWGVWERKKITYNAALSKENSRKQLSWKADVSQSKA